MPIVCCPMSSYSDYNEFHYKINISDGVPFYFKHVIHMYVHAFLLFFKSVYVVSAVSFLETIHMVSYEILLCLKFYDN